MQEIKVKKPGSKLLIAALVCLVLYFGYVIIGQRIAIGEKQQQLSSLQQQISVQELVNEELRHDIEETTGNDEHLEDVARSEYDYAMPGERVFINIAGE